ncbi:DUF4863 family protein [Nannocystaceae bacterium ST9]
MTAPNARLLELLDPILARVAALDPASCTEPERTMQLEATLEHEFPHAGEHAQAIAREIERGIAEGWLCDRGDASARFSRLAKPSPATHGMSIDVVSMLGEGLEHTHPKGEVTLGFPAERQPGAHSCQFEARPPAWVFLPPGSRHVPRVIGERMNLIYFLPDGAAEWHPRT